MTFISDLFSNGISTALVSLFSILASSSPLSPLAECSPAGYCFLAHLEQPVAGLEEHEDEGAGFDDLLEDIQSEPDRTVYVDNQIEVPENKEMITGLDPYEQLPIYDWEKKIIAKIVTTMANNNIIQLGFKKSSLEKKGKKINHVHPLRFLGYVFSEADLKKCMVTIRKSSFKWDGFIDGLSRRMREEANNNNLAPYVIGFSKAVNADPEQVMEFVTKRDFEGLVRYLLH